MKPITIHNKLTKKDYYTGIFHERKHGVKYVCFALSILFIYFGSIFFLRALHLFGINNIPTNLPSIKYIFPIIIILAPFFLIFAHFILNNISAAITYLLSIFVGYFYMCITTYNEDFIRLSDIENATIISSLFCFPVFIFLGISENLRRIFFGLLLTALTFPLINYILNNHRLEPPALEILWAVCAIIYCISINTIETINSGEAISIESVFYIFIINCFSTLLLLIYFNSTINIESFILIITTTIVTSSVLFSIFTRLPLHIILLIYNFINFRINVQKKKCELISNPLLISEINYFSFPNLENTIVKNAFKYPAETMRVLELCAHSPGQIKISRLAHAKIQAITLLHYLRNNLYEEIHQLKSPWLQKNNEGNEILKEYRAISFLLSKSGKQKSFATRKACIETAKSRSSTLKYIIYNDPENKFININKEVYIFLENKIKDIELEIISDLRNDELFEKILIEREWGKVIELMNNKSFDNLYQRFSSGEFPNLRKSFMFDNLSAVLRNIQAFNMAETNYAKMQYILNITPILKDMSIKKNREPIATIRMAFTEIITKISTATTKMQMDANEFSRNEIPQIFITNPISPKENRGKETFVGREKIICQIEELLANQNQNNSITLLGPRRCGKSSLLKMLPLKMPDAISIFFDLQDNPATTPQNFLYRLMQRIVDQTREQSNFVIQDPKHDDADISKFQLWLEMLDKRLGKQRLLLCIDEFERLPFLFPGDERALLQLMGLLRATVQHRHNIRLLLAGVAPFDELDPMWSDHFINMRELRVEHLPADAALQLLMRPIPNFNAIPEDVARKVMARTGCQPLLLQLYGGMLVNRLNAEKRTTATLADAQAVDDAVLEQGNAVNHFGNLYDTAPDNVKTALRRLAAGGTPELNTATRRYLLRRCLITPDGGPGIPVFLDWVAAERGDN